MEENKKIESAEYVDSTANEEENSFSFKTLYTMFILNWQWFVLSVIVCLGCATLYLRYKSPTYQVAVKMLVKDDNNKMRSGGNTQMLSNMQDLGFISNSNGIDNEIEILSAHDLAQDAVYDMKLYTSYYHKGTFKDQIVYKTQEVNVDLDSKHIKKLNAPIKMTIERNGSNYQIKGSYFVPIDAFTTEKEPTEFERTFAQLPASIRTKVGTIYFTKNGALLWKISSTKSCD